jgi:hypothetical protein
MAVKTALVVRLSGNRCACLYADASCVGVASATAAAAVAAVAAAVVVAAAATALVATADCCLAGAVYQHLARAELCLPRDQCQGS